MEWQEGEGEEASSVCYDLELSVQEHRQQWVKLQQGG